MSIKPLFTLSCMVSALLTGISSSVIAADAPVAEINNHTNRYPHELISTESQQKATLEILKTLNKRHFLHLPIDDALSARLLENYIDKLDPDKFFFIQSDINEFKRRQFHLDDELKAGKNTTGFAIYKRFRERMDERLRYAMSLLNSHSAAITDFTIDERLEKRDADVAWPADTFVANDLWRKRIKSYLLSQKLTGKSIKQSSEKLLKQYQSQLNRLHKGTAEDVYERYINAFTQLYDPHTNYFSPRSSENFSINMSLSLEGIGAVLQIDDGYTRVVRIVTGGPAHKQGELQVSDKISGVAQGKQGEVINVIGWRLDEVVDLIRGPKDSIVRLEVVSSEMGKESTKMISITRDKVKLEDQAAQKAIIELKHHDNTIKIGVIHIPTFYLDFEALQKRNPNYRSTAKDVKRLLSELERENVQGVVIDLRNNGGGSLYEAIAVTDLFVDQGPVVQVGAGNGRKKSDFSRNNAYYRGPLAVLINRLSASASEIFAGAIQDYRRGLIVGSTSFGKGTVQTLAQLKSQGELKITESKFYRISGDSTQHRGIVPDIVMPELIDVSQVGESSYDTALPWSQASPVKHHRYPLSENVLQQLSAKHNARITQNPSFVYLRERKTLLNEANQEQSIALKEMIRIKENTARENKLLMIENNHRQAKKLPAYTSFAEYKEKTEEDNKARDADRGKTTIDTEDDAILIETGHILKDFIELHKQPSKTLVLH